MTRGACWPAFAALASIVTIAAIGSPSEAAGPAVRKPKVTAYFATGFEDIAWQKDAHARIVKSWKPAAIPAPGKKTVVITVIAKDGKIIGARDNMLSGDAAWDKAAFEAVRASGSFAPLPNAWPHPTLEVHWHFETGS